MSRPAVVLDACVLIPIRLATTLLWLAEAGLFQPLWSAQILDEVERNLPRLGVPPAQAARRVAAMRNAFGNEAMVDGFDHLVDQMACDPKDRHVLAVAAHDGADALMTFNLKDFPVAAAKPYGVETVHPDRFLAQLLGSSPIEVGTVLDAAVRELRKPPQTALQWLSGLTSTVPIFANLAANLAGGPSADISPIPALMATDEAAARAGFGEPGDLTNPAHAALVWCYGLSTNLEAAMALTYDPAAWGDYQWAIEQITNRSLASGVLMAVDAPDRIAYLKLIPEVAQPSVTFAPFLAEVTFMTMIKIEDGTWRVWGLGPAILPAREVLGS